jgi:hypothetical protein
MDYREPNLTISGKDFMEANSLGVYAWFRGGIALYVGYSQCPIGRIGHHNVIGSVDRVLPSDEFRFWAFDDPRKALLFEQQLEAELGPKYSLPLKRGEVRKVPCAVCRTKFVQKRWWQKFCSTKCRTGKGWSK